MFIKKLKELIKNNFYFYYKKSYSQEGEDMILNRFLESTNSGFYVDLGAHHPKRFSNTFFFYKKGWSGINVDAKPGSMFYFNKFRAKDINLEIGVNTKRDYLEFYMFNESALNTFDKNLAISRCNSRYYIVDIQKVKCMSLENILDKFLPINQTITFLTVDLEGFDLIALSTNNWEKYRPNYLIVESYQIFIDQLLNDELYKYIITKNYRLVSKSYYSLIFKDNNTQI
jgi:hypothetical protein